jgi:dTDP-L-rhamnose 4-epimerase
MKILVTGGAGFIGTHLSKALAIDLHHEVIILDNFAPQIHGDEVQIQTKQAALSRFARVIVGSVMDYALVAEALHEADWVVHLAAETGVGQSMYAVRRYVEVNDLGTATLFEALVKEPHHVERIVLASSRAIYGEGAYRSAQHGLLTAQPRTYADLQRGIWEPHSPIAGDTINACPSPVTLAAAPVSVYGVTKYNQELQLRLLNQVMGLTTVILRFFNVYGEGQSLNNPYTGILTAFAKAITAGQPPSIYEDGKPSRDFVHVEDIVQALLLGLTKPLSDVATFNVGSGTATTIYDLATQLTIALGQPLTPKITGEFRVGDIRHSLADISTTQEVLGYTPRVSLAEGIERFTRWLHEQPLAGTTSPMDVAFHELQRHNLGGSVAPQE